MLDMADWKRKVKGCLLRKGKTIIWIILVTVITYCVYRVLHCYRYPLEGVVCMEFHGRLANAMFQQAFLYTFAKDKKLDVLIYGKYPHPLSNVFELNDFIWKEDINGSCSCYSMVTDKWDCAFDDSFQTLPQYKTAHVDGFFQSWKYIKRHEAGIRKMFTFHHNIRKTAEKHLRFIIETKKSVGITQESVLVGIHIRRGDYVKIAHYRNFGYEVATDKYLYKAVDYFQKRYSNLLFIVAGNDIKWAKKFLGNNRNVYFLEDNSPALDMAILSQTNHTIMTVGTFGWWISYLTNGTTLYYKHPYRKGSDFELEFHGSTSEHFPPDWIGLE